MFRSEVAITNDPNAYTTPLIRPKFNRKSKLAIINLKSQNKEKYELENSKTN